MIKYVITILFDPSSQRGVRRTPTCLDSGLLLHYQKPKTKTINKYYKL